MTLQVHEITDRAAEKAMATMLRRSNENRRAIVTVGDVVWATLEVLEEDNLIELDRSHIQKKARR
jgi:hypothetical protein